MAEPDRRTPMRYDATQYTSYYSTLLVGIPRRTLRRGETSASMAVVVVYVSTSQRWRRSFHPNVHKVQYPVVSILLTARDEHTATSHRIVQHVNTMQQKHSHRDNCRGPAAVDGRRINTMTTQPTCFRLADKKKYLPHGFVMYELSTRQKFV